MRLLLARHGESEGNVRRRLQDGADPLTERGRAQARRLAAALAARGDIMALYASPMPRAWETASLVGAALGLAPTPVAGLGEMDCGDATGLSYDEFDARWPDLSRALLAGASEAAWPGGETLAGFRGRVVAAVDAVVAAHAAGETVAVIAHGGSLSWAVAHLLGEVPAGWPRYQFDNGGVTIVDLAARPGRIICLNDLAHLGAGR